MSSVQLQVYYDNDDQEYDHQGYCRFRLINSDVQKDFFTIGWHRIIAVDGCICGRKRVRVYRSNEEVVPI